MSSADQERGIDFIDDGTIEDRDLQVHRGAIENDLAKTNYASERRHIILLLFIQLIFIAVSIYVAISNKDEIGIARFKWWPFLLINFVIMIGVYMILLKRKEFRKPKL